MDQSARPWSRRDLLRASGGLAALGAASLAGCSGLTPDSSENGDDGPVTFTTADGEPDGPFGDSYQLVAAAFKDRYPDWTHEWHPRPSPTELVQTLPAKIANGSLETTFMLPSASLGVPMALGQLAEITEGLADWEHFDELEPAYLEAASRDGRRFGHAYTGGYFGMVINRKMFLAAGLDPDAPPTTWEDFEEAALRLAKPDDDTYGYAVLNGVPGAWQYLGWLYAAGGRVQKQAPDGLWVASLDEGPALQALELYHRMRWQDQSMSPRMYAATAEMNQDLAAGRLGMFIGQANSIAGVMSLQEQFGLEVGDIGLGPLPQGGGNATLAQASVYAFSGKASGDAVTAALQWTLFRAFDPEAVEIRKRSLAEDEIAIPPLDPRELALKVDSPLRAELSALSAKYTDTPLELLAPFIESGGVLEQVDEPPYGPQVFYDLMTPALQAAVTEEDSDLADWVATVNEQVTTQILDPVQ